MTSNTMTRVGRVGFLPRLVAYLVDMLATWAVIGLIGGVLSLALRTAGAGDATANAVWPLTAITVITVYFTVLHAHHRQTVGKRIIGAVVTAPSLEPIGHGRSFGRLVAEIISSIPFYLGYLWALWDPEKQTFHDKLATTVVVRKGDLPAGQH
jgi:uncharacterized RDD family membrane protein YckC